MEIIDIHAHYPMTKDMIKDERNVYFLEKLGVSFLKDSSIKQLIDAMDAAMISKTCLMGPNYIDRISYTNEMVHEVVLKHPDRLIGFCGIDPFKNSHEIRLEIDNCIDKYGFKGIGELGGFNFMDSNYSVLFQACVEKKIPVLIHTGIPLPSMHMKYCHPHMIDDLAIQYPELNIIMAHAGSPWIIEALAVAMRHKNVYVDISNLLSFSPILFKILLLTYTQSHVYSRLLFGTDYPGCDQRKYIKAIKKGNFNAILCFLFRIPRISKENIQAILGGNAKRLLSI